MNRFQQNINIIVDNREKSSGVPEMLTTEGVNVSFMQLSIGDYMIDDEIIIERKTNEDFANSIINGRLFDQCARMVKTGMRSLFIVEGNPFLIKSNISVDAIKGAWLSVSLSWQIPIVNATDKKDTVGFIITAAKQQLFPYEFIRKKGKKPKTKPNLQQSALQSFPNVGPVLAQRLLKQFGSIKNIVELSEKSLANVEGIGKTKAKMLLDFFKSEEKY